MVIYWLKGGKMLISKRDQNKDRKRERLLAESYKLFTEKDINTCSVSTIAHRAGIAKGTFYLYFSDKYELLNALVLEKSSDILSKAMNASVALPNGKISDRAIFIVNYVIEFFINNKKVLKLIDKNLSWGMFVEAIENNDSYSNIKELSDVMVSDFKRAGVSQEKASQIIFIIIEMVGSVCYSSIILEQPASIDVMKPLLFDMIHKMLDE